MTKIKQTSFFGARVSTIKLSSSMVSEGAYHTLVFTNDTVRKSIYHETKDEALLWHKRFCAKFSALQGK